MTTQSPRGQDGDARTERSDPVAASARLLQFPRRPPAQAVKAASVTAAEAELLGAYNLHNG